MNEILHQAYSLQHIDQRRIDLYMPRRKANGGAILWIHGGGFSAGNKEQWSACCAHFASMGYVCGSVGYRMLPDWHFPSCLEDVRLAMHYFRSHGPKFGFDPNRIATIGSSAGGYLALMLGLLGEEDTLGQTDEMSSPPARAAAVVAYCPVTAMAWREDPENCRDVFGFDPTEEQLVANRAQSYVRGEEPPMLFLHGREDETVPYEVSETLVLRLKEHGGTVELISPPGAGHGFGYGTETPPQQFAIEHVERFLETHLLPEH